MGRKSSSSHGNDDFSSGVPFSDIPDGFRNLAQRVVASIYDGVTFPGGYGCLCKGQAHVEQSANLTQSR